MSFDISGRSVQSALPAGKRFVAKPRYNVPIRACRACGGHGTRRRNGHQGRTEVGAENRREGHVGGEKAFGLNARHDERGGGGALEKRCERGARRHGDGPVLEPDGDEVLEGHTEGAEHPGLDHVGSPEQEGDASGHVDERLHKSLPPWKNVLKIGGCLSILAEGPFKVLFLRENAL